jgi:hypothetical protein
LASNYSVITHIGRSKSWPGPALVALVALAVYASTLSYQFVYDDRYVIVLNTRLHDLANWWEIIVQPWWPAGLYRPFTSLTFAANWALGQGAPFGFHLVNVLVHAAASALVWVLASRLMPLPAALAGALLFAVHPVHVEAVASVVGRAETLATLFVLLAALCYLRYGDPGGEEARTAARRRGAGFGALAAGVLALASKESAFALPAILLVVDWAGAQARAEEYSTRLARTWRLWCATLVVSLGWLWLRTAVVGDLVGDTPAPGLAGTSLGERIAIMLPVVTEYLRLLLFPLRLSADYSPDFLPASPVFSIPAFLGLALFLGCVALALWARRRAWVVTAGLAWTGASIFVVSNLVVPTGVVLAERTLYLASAGVCLAVGWAWGWGFQRRPRMAVALLALVLAVAAGRTWSRSGVWRDDATFFPRLIADAPGSYRADWVAGMLSYMAGDSVSGERLMWKGFRTYQGNAAMWSDFAVVMERQRRWGEAATYFWASFLADSTRGSDAARAVANHVQGGRLDSAQVLLEAAQRVLPDSRDLAISESHLALARGDAARSLALRWKAARELADDWRYWLLTAEAAVPARECRAVDEALERVRALRPGMRWTEKLADSARALGC